MSGKVLPIDEAARADLLFKPYLGARVLNVGCGRCPVHRDGWVNLDVVPDQGADVVCTLGRDRIPFPDGAFDTVFASQVLEHIPQLIDAMREIHRVLTPGGYLIAGVPYGSADGAWEDPTHVRAFFEQSWGFFDRRLYERPGYASYYPSPVDFCFEVVRVDLVPCPGIVEEGPAGETQAECHARIRRLMQRQRNIIQEMQAVLRKVEG